MTDVLSQMLGSRGNFQTTENSPGYYTVCYGGLLVKYGGFENDIIFFVSTVTLMITKVLANT